MIGYAICGSFCTHAKAMGALEDIRARYPDKVILLACHNGICRTAHSYFNDMTNEEFMSYVEKNAGFRVYEL